MLSLFPLDCVCVFVCVCLFVLSLLFCLFTIIACCDVWAPPFLGLLVEAAAWHLPSLGKFKLVASSFQGLFVVFSKPLTAPRLRPAHTCTHTHTHTHVHTHTHMTHMTHMHTYTHTHTCTRKLSCALSASFFAPPSLLSCS